jgi:hypothetical protein
MRAQGWLAGLAWALAVSGCTRILPSLGPGLHDNAVAYDAAISDINDQVLLANIVRARDYVPLNITELSTVTGTLSEQASLGLSVPFGGNYGSTPRGTVTPSVQVAAAPTFSMAALNTRGFTLNIIQPISPVYIASKWNTGISKELLLLLFVKDIQFADSFAASMQDCSSNQTSASPEGDRSLVACHHKFINNPDSPGEERAFKAVIESMLPTVGIKVMSILEPIGPAFPFLPRNPADDKNPLDAYALTTHLGDGQYHVGNYEHTPGQGQLFRVFANQVAVCAQDPVKTEYGTFYIYPVGADIVTAHHAETVRKESPGIPFEKEWEERLELFKAQCSTGEHPGDRACAAAAALMGKPKSAPGASAFGSYALVMSAIGGGGAQSAAEPPPSGRAGSNAGATTGTAMPAVSASLQENRVGAFLRANDCYADQTVREPTTETDFKKYTETLGHIEWRSVAEVFQYLGAVLRRPEGITWTVRREREIVGSSDGAIPDTMFALRRAGSDEGKRGKLKIDYGGDRYSIGSGNLTAGAAQVNDQSLLVLSLLNELVNSAKISSDIPVTQQLQVLP